jgi:hypothetical protein
MSGENNKQMAKLYLSLLAQHSITQLNAIESKYSQYLNHLTTAQKSLKEQIEVGLYPYLNTWENQKQFNWLCEKIQFEVYLEQEYSIFLAVLKIKEVAEFLAGEEKKSKEKFQQENEFTSSTSMEKQELLNKIQALQKRAEEAVMQLQKQIEQLHSEIDKLQTKRNELAENVTMNSRILDKFMTAAYENLNLSNKVEVIEVEGISLSYSYDEIANDLAKHFKGKIESGQILVENIQQEERFIISRSIYQKIPEDKLATIDRRSLDKLIVNIHDKLKASLMTEENYAECQHLTKEILTDRKEIEFIDVAIKIKNKIIEVKKDEIAQINQLLTTIERAANNKEISAEAYIEASEKLHQIEEVHINHNEIYVFDNSLKKNDQEEILLDDDLNLDDEVASIPSNINHPPTTMEPEPNSKDNHEHLDTKFTSVNKQFFITERRLPSPEIKNEISSLAEAKATIPEEEHNPNYSPRRR